jgi:hypothetical protein
MFDKKSTDVAIEGFDVNDPACWLKINPKLTGFYRVGERLDSTVIKDLLTRIKTVFFY